MTETDHSEVIHNGHGYAFAVESGECGVGIWYREINSDEWIEFMGQASGEDMREIICSLIRVLALSEPDGAAALLESVGKACKAVEGCAR